MSSSQWFDGLSPKETELLKGQLDSYLAHRLKTILTRWKTAAESNSLSKQAYENPNWAYKQADTVGYTRALNEVTTLLTITKE